MKIIKKTLMGLAVIIGFTSCSSLFYDAKADLLQSIHKGMSKKEIADLVGQPQYRRFDRDLEEWEYLKVLSNGAGPTVIIVSFENDRVAGMNSFPSSYRSSPSVTVTENRVTPPAPPFMIYAKGMSEADFQRFYEKVKSLPFKDDQLKLMQVGAENNHLTCKQCAHLMSLYYFDDDRMKVLKQFAPHIADRENYEEILNAFDSLFKKDDAKKLLGV